MKNSGALIFARGLVFWKCFIIWVAAISFKSRYDGIITQVHAYNERRQMLHYHSNRLKSHSFYIAKPRGSFLSIPVSKLLAQGKLQTLAVQLRGGGNGTPLQSSVTSSAMGSVRRGHLFGRWCHKNFFLLGMLVAVATARWFPALGRDGSFLRPEIWIGQYAVMAIFFLSGLSLQLYKLTQAAANVKLNALIQVITFAVWPVAIGLPMKWILTGFLPRPLVDGLIIVSCLPTTVNMCVILTAAAGANVAAALTNAVLSNLAGIFLTPALLIRFLASDAMMDLPFWAMLRKLSNKVLVPVALGQMFRATPLKDMYNKHITFWKRSQEVILLSILWNAFCTAISSQNGLDLADGLKLFLVLPILHSMALTVAFGVFSRCNFPRSDVIAATFCASHKTLAFGLPLIRTIFEGSPNVMAYSAPIMLLHPVQLTMGSLLMPRLERYVNGERQEQSKRQIKK